MSKILVLLLATLTSTLAYSWDDSRKDTNSQYNNGYDRDNTPKSHTLSGSSYRRSDNEYDTRTPEQVNRGTNGSYSNSTGRNTQINNNGLIINRE